MCHKLTFKGFYTYIIFNFIWKISIFRCNPKKATSSCSFMEGWFIQCRCNLHFLCPRLQACTLSVMCVQTEIISKKLLYKIKAVNINMPCLSFCHSFKEESNLYCQCYKAAAGHMRTCVVIVLSNMCAARTVFLTLFILILLTSQRCSDILARR